MSAPDHLAQLAADTAVIGEVLRDTDLDSPVQDCPGWLLRDLALHLGRVHRWATRIVRTGVREPEPEAPVTDAALAAWFEAGAAALQSELAGDPDRPVWTFSGPGTARFWQRRQALETAVHRVDAQSCAGQAQPVPDDLAEDGVAEVVEVLHSRQVQRGRTLAPTCSARLVATTGGSWLLGDGPICATVTGPPSDLLLLLWRRRPREHPSLTVEGDVAALDGLLASGLTA